VHRQMSIWSQRSKSTSEASISTPMKSRKDYVPMMQFLCVRRTWQIDV
jgi:hypothetical protein